MGHLVGKDVYRQLGKKIDGLTVRTPWSRKLYDLLRELYTAEEAEVVARMPYSLSDLDRIARTTGHEKTKLRKILDTLSGKGLVLDLHIRGRSFYMANPFVIGIFEFTMMRTGDEAASRKWAGLFHAYMQDDRDFFDRNLRVLAEAGPIRTLPHEGAVDVGQAIEVLDYEKASSIVEGSKKFSVGLCSCRHVKHHMGDRKCGTPLETCSSFDNAADYLIRHNLAKEVSKAGMQENLARSREMGLVFNADNVQRRITFICHCCKCCCEPLTAARTRGSTRTIVTSSMIATHDPTACERCAKCVRACPVRGINMVPAESPRKGRRKIPRIDEEICLGCGVCALKCESKALRLVRRRQRVIHPETTFERVILQCLEAGTLQNQIFDDPTSKSQEWMRAFLGGVLRLPPVKRALLGDTMRSAFLSSMKKGVARKGRAWVTRM